VASRTPGEASRQSDEDLRQALVASEALLHQILERTETGSWQWDIAANVVSWSENLGPIHGLDRGAQPDDYEGYLELIHPDDRERIAAAVQTALAHGKDYEIEMRTNPERGELRWIWAGASVIRGPDGEPVRIVGLTRDITERKTREERERALAESVEQARREADLAARDAERLQEVTAGLSAAATTAEIADVIVNQGIPVLSASTGIFGVLEGADELHFVRSIGYGGVFPERLRLDEPWPITQAVRRKEVIELRDVAERRSAYAVPETIWAESAQGTLVAVPLLLGSRVLGALGFTREDSKPLTRRERTLVETLARQAAQALDRALLYETDRRARVQAEGLQRVASAVATAATVEDVAAAVTREALNVLEADGVTVLLTRSSNAADAEVLASAGSVERHATGEPSVNLAAGTLTAAAIRSRTALYAESIGELEASWPASVAVARELGVGAIACVPVRVGQRLGAISLVVGSPKRFLPEERTFLDLLARACEQGLIRAELYEAERDAHVRSGLLHDLSAALSGALVPFDVGHAFLDRVLDFVGAGSGSLMLVDPDGQTLTGVAVAGPGATRHRWRSELPVAGDYLITTAFRRGQACAATSQAELERRFPDTAAVFGDLAQSGYALPLLVRGVPIGAFGLVFEGERSLTPEDQRLLATMSDLCAQALERAQLYESEHRIALRLQRALLPDGVVEHPDVMIAARYEASGESMEVGGDWYDTFAFPDGRIGVAVGDVVGHGIEAAASMGRLRSAFSAFASDLSDPGELLERLDRFAAGPGGVEFATACFAMLDPNTGVLRYASAGHPPMLLVSPEGETTWLDDGRSQPLYGALELERPEASAVLEAGSLLLLYSDGLVERRGERISAGL
jgi:PAS domain S-box-containing protein